MRSDEKQAMSQAEWDRNELMMATDPETYDDIDYDWLWDDDKEEYGEDFISEENLHF